MTTRNTEDYISAQRTLRACSKPALPVGPVSSCDDSGLCIVLACLLMKAHQRKTARNYLPPVSVLSLCVPSSWNNTHVP